MKKNVMQIFAVAASLIAGLLIYLLFFYLYKPVNVVVAVRDLQAVKPITEADVTTVKVASADRQDGAFTDVRQVIGSYTAVPIYEGQQIITKQIVRDPGKMVSEMESMSPDKTIIVLKEQDAVWTPVLKPGDYATVFAVLETGEVSEIAHGKVVSATGSSVVQDIKNLKEAQAQPSQKTLLMTVTIEQATRIMSAIKTSKGLYVVPRHPALGG